MLLGGNRTGKSFSGSNEGACHLTGKYPSWWEGKRFDKPIIAWAASVTAELTRDGLQVCYLGSQFEDKFGTGSIPKEDILGFTRRQGIANAVDTVKVQHYDRNGTPDGISELTFKSYDQGRAKFQAAAIHFAHLDEEPDYEIFTETVTRTATTGGQVILTMTPLDGMTDTCLYFMQSADKNTWYTTMGWDDVDHLDEETKEALAATYPPHEIEARRKGVPTVGRGKIYPFKEEDVVVDAFPLPDDWLYAYGMDVGWNATAVVFASIDPNTDIVYIYDVYKEGAETNGVGLDPAQHVAALSSRGIKNLPGVCDPSADRVNSTDGAKLLELYKNEGLQLRKADNSVSSGITEVFQGLRTGKIKVFSHLQPWLHEMNMYHRDRKNKVVKKNDHLMDATRYLIVSGLTYARRKVGGLNSMKRQIKRASSWLTM
jgi:phage terminase large subunit-like protein